MYGPRLRQGHYVGYQSTPMRQHPYPIIQGMNGNQPAIDFPYMNPYTIQGSQYFYPPAQGAAGYHQQVPSHSSFSQNVFHNPLQGKQETYGQMQQQVQPNGYSYMNPYPKGSFLAKPPSGMKSVLNSFKSQDGSLDINKMVDTAGQMINAVSQVSSVVKGFGGMFKV
ncbi:YppG family protein [Niallia oryzisoli]|uniref:YppG family protein n=1 Tax=Niallia oryzisoli TaxID=1737571 RepID=UPI003736393F